MVRRWPLRTSATPSWRRIARQRRSYSFIVGLPVAGILYWILAKSVDVEAETKVAKTVAEELERLARAHRRPNLNFSREFVGGGCWYAKVPVPQCRIDLSKVRSAQAGEALCR
jgi:hypothetical protein